jgi:hypothetical protein
LLIRLWIGALAYYLDLSAQVEHIHSAESGEGEAETSQKTSNHRIICHPQARACAAIHTRIPEVGSLPV